MSAKKKGRSVTDIYRGIRKRVPAPTRVERDRRHELERRDAEKQDEEHLGRRGRPDDDRKERE